MSPNFNQAVDLYKQVGTQGGVAAADPHRLILMLFDGALERIANARGGMLRNETELKGVRISQAIKIIDGLRASLNKNTEGDLARTLDGLYDYMQRRLVEANLNNDQQVLLEVAALLREIRDAWDAIPDEARRAFPAATT